MKSAHVDVFVSYRHREPSKTWVRQQLVPALKAAGLTVIIDEHDFVPSEVLLEEIERASAAARVTLAVVDEWYQDSWFTRFEQAIGARLLVVVKGDVESVPVAAHTVDLRDRDDTAEVVEALHAAIKRVFVLESESDEPWVEGYLIPSLRRADVDARHVGDLGAEGEWEAEAIEREIEAADRVIVVLSAAYLIGRHHDEGARLAQWEAMRKKRKTVPVLLEDPGDLELPLRYEAMLMIDMHDRSLWDAALERICTLLDVPPPRRDVPPECPYPGMMPYGKDGKYPFVGRDDEIDRVIDRLERRHVAAVIGPSASGKSSLILAGVLPRIRERGLHGRPRTHIEVIRPVDDPEPALRRLSAVTPAVLMRRRPGSS